MSHASASVIIASFNGEPFVGEALESVLAQSVPPLEVIVCDDGSSDGTVDVLCSFGDRIRCIRQTNQGVSAARNRAAAGARGRYLAFLDQDDLWERDFLRRQLEAFEEHPDRGLMYADSWVIDSTGRVRGRRSQHLRFAEGRIFEALLRGNFIPIETLVMPSALFRELGGFRVDLSFLEDFDLCLRASRTHAVGFIPEPLARYRIHARNLSHDGAGIAGEYLKLVEELALDPTLSPEERRIVEEERRRRCGDLAWLALRRAEPEEAERWIQRLGGITPSWKVRLLRRVERALPRSVSRRLVALLPRRRLYGI